MTIFLTETKAAGTMENGLQVGYGKATCRAMPQHFRCRSRKTIRVAGNWFVPLDLMAAMTDIASVNDASAEEVYLSNNIDRFHAQELPMFVCELADLAVGRAPSNQSALSIVASRALPENRISHLSHCLPPCAP